MPNGRLRYYYWRLFSALAEQDHLLDRRHPDFNFPDEDDVEYRERLKALIVFRDGSRLFARARLDATAAVREFDYAYVYLSPDGNRIFQYDDAPHHAHISTHPHHRHVGPVPTEGKDEPLPSDLPQVDFFTIFAKIVTEYFTKRGK